MTGLTCTIEPCCDLMIVLIRSPIDHCHLTTTLQLHLRTTAMYLTWNPNRVLIPQSPTTPDQLWVNPHEMPAQISITVSILHRQEIALSTLDGSSCHTSSHVTQFSETLLLLRQEFGLGVSLAFESLRVLVEHGGFL